MTSPDVKYRIQTITPGRVRRLIGGNLGFFFAIVGSPYLFKWGHPVLEDVNENIYRLDRLMTHLKIAGVFDRLAGFIFGQCPECKPDADYGSHPRRSGNKPYPTSIPAWYGAMIGHVEPILTLPIGLEVEIECWDYQMLEPAVA